MLTHSLESVYVQSLKIMLVQYMENNVCAILRDTDYTIISGRHCTSPRNCTISSDNVCAIDKNNNHAIHVDS